jgi:hypothetical protein
LFFGKEYFECWPQGTAGRERRRLAGRQLIARRCNASKRFSYYGGDPEAQPDSHDDANGEEWENRQRMKSFTG